jgi:hypothetical protein
MATPTFTRRLQDAARRGQEIVADPDGLRVGVVPVTHDPRSDTDPMPWAARTPYGSGERFKASQCYARLALPLPAGAVVEHVQGGKRGLYAGPPAEGPAGFAVVEFHAKGQAPHRLTISRNLLRLVTA